MVLKWMWRRLNFSGRRLPVSLLLAVVLLVGMLPAPKTVATGAAFLLLMAGAVYYFFSAVRKDRRCRKISALAAVLAAGAALLLPYEELGRLIRPLMEDLNLASYAGAGLAAVSVVLPVSLFFLLAAVTGAILRLAENPAFSAPGRPGPVRWTALFKYSLFPLLGFLLAAAQSFPARLTRDSWYQLAQIQGTRPLDNVHTVGHTLLAGLLMKIWDSPAVVVLFQAVVMALLFGWILAFFETKGIEEKVLTGTAVFIAVFPANREIIPFFWKDVLYTAALLLVTIVLIEITAIRRAAGNGEKDRSRVVYLWLAIGLAGVCLFRHNGILVAVVLSLFFAWRAMKFKDYKPLGAALLALVMVAAVYGYAFGARNASSALSGSRWAIFGKAVAAVAARDGVMTLEEKSRINELIPLELARKYYRWDRGEELLWDLGRSEPPYLDGYRFHLSLEARHRDVLALFFQLFPRNALLMTKDLLGSSCIVWRFSPALLNCHVFFLYLLIPGLVLLARRQPLALLPFAPVLLSAASIFISVTTYEWRYIYPTLALFPVFLLYTVQTLAAGARSRCR